MPFDAAPADDLAAPAQAGAADLGYASTQGRLAMRRRLGRNLAAAHWLYRLARNAQLEQERSFSRYRRRQLAVGDEPPRRPSAFEQFDAVSSLRAADANGPAFAEASAFPVAMLRAAVREVHDAVAGCAKRWARGERASMPRYRSADEAQTIRVSAFRVLGAGAGRWCVRSPRRLTKICRMRPARDP